MLTDDEAVAVVLGLIAADRIGLAADGAGRPPRAEAKIAPGAARRRWPSGWPRCAAQPRLHRAGAAGGTTPPGVATRCSTLGAATRAHERLDAIDLPARRGRATTARDLDPYGLVFHSGRWYAVGHDHRSGEIRTFRADRIVARHRRPGAVRAAGRTSTPVGHV